MCNEDDKYLYPLRTRNRGVHRGSDQSSHCRGTFSQPDYLDHDHLPRQFQQVAEAVTYLCPEL